MVWSEALLVVESMLWELIKGSNQVNQELRVPNRPQNQAQALSEPSSNLIKPAQRVPELSSSQNQSFCTHKIVDSDEHTRDDDTNQEPTESTWSQQEVKGNRREEHKNAWRYNRLCRCVGRNLSAPLIVWLALLLMALLLARIYQVNVLIIVDNGAGCCHGLRCEVIGNHSTRYQANRLP